MARQKIFILLPDGVGLRNFAFTNFYDLGKEKGFDIVFWNNTNFDLLGLGFRELKIENAKNHLLTDVYKNAKKQIELDLSIHKSGNSIYDLYRVPLSYGSVKATFKSLATRMVASLFSNTNGMLKIRNKIGKLERKTAFYRACLQTLQEEKPALVFCTNQRHISTIAPILAAQDLGIPTASFIFSWDNLPKATIVIDTDYYFVWSDHMKKELLYYYNDILESQIVVSGTPQFEPHFDNDITLSRSEFFLQNGLDMKKKYICFSGDDETTSPNDPDYLEDLANAVTHLNDKGFNLGIIFRRCPVDFSGRYDAVLMTHRDIIVSISPKWSKVGAAWSNTLPQKEDMALLANTVRHSEMVVNLGSSMVFDYAAHEKPCCFINYDSPKKKPENIPIKKIYDFIHFQSMTSKNCVVWLNNWNEIADKIEQMLTNKSEMVKEAKVWFEKINSHPPERASVRIWNGISEILAKKKL